MNFKIALLALLAIVWMNKGNAQTTVFSDDFANSTSNSWTTAGSIGSTSWNVNRSGVDYGARRQIANQLLELTNDASTAGNANGWVFAYLATADFTNPFSNLLSSNPGQVSWWFNMRQIRTDPSGFASGNYGVAFILGSTSNSPFASGSGYAVVLGQSGSSDPVRLASFNNGLSGTLNNIITSNTTGLSDFGSEYLSIKVTYDPSNHQWELFLRNDGASAFANPQSGTLFSQGTAVDATYTNTSLEYAGGFWNGATAANQTAFFDNLTIKVTASAVPSVNVNPGSLTGFQYTVGAGPSAAQTFIVSGANLTSQVSLAAPTHYEISLTSNANYGKTLQLNHVGGTLAATTIYVRLESGLEAGNYANETLTVSATGASDATLLLSGQVNAPVNEPSEHPATFTASTNTDTSLILAWDDAQPAADGYLIKGNTTGYTTIANPTDGIPEANNSLVQNVDAGTQLHQFSGLNPGTSYYFKLFPYNGSGASINYKTDGSIPQTTASTLAPTQTTYTWVGPNNGSWATATNWSPARTSPQASDLIQFNDGGTYTITGLSTQTIARLSVTNNSKITLQAASTGQTLNISNDAGDDLLISAGAELNISGSNTLTINLLSGATGQISGKVSLAGGGHRLTAASSSAISFGNGSTFAAGTGMSGNPFGTTNLNSVIFATGAVYEQLAGSNPFGASAPNSVVVFQPGSLFRLKANLTPSLSGRTYANFEFDVNGTINASGSSAMVMDQLEVKQGTFNLNLTGNPGHTIKGNVIVHSSASLGFNPTAAGTVLLGGSALQTISGGGNITGNNNSTLIINNTAGVWMDNHVTLQGQLQVNPNAILQVQPTRQLTVNGTLTNSGTFILKSNASGTASLMHNSDNVPATIERYITGSTNLSSSHYHLVSVPLNAGVTTAQFLGSYLYRFDVATQQWLGLGSSLTTPLSNDQGYLIFYPNNSTTYHFVGQMNNGPFTPAIMTGANQFALVPNPYPSAIDWDAASGWTKTNIQDAIWIWNPAGLNYASYSGGVGVNGGTKYIPAGQAYFVKSTASSPALSMNNGVRVHNNQAFWKSATADGLLRIKSAGNGKQDEIALRMRTQSQAGLDHGDVDKLFGADIVPQIYFIVDNKEVAINSIPPDALPISVPVAFKMNAAGQASMHFEGMESFGSEVQFVLEDLLTGAVVNLREVPAYSFSHQPGNNAQRFVLHLKTFIGIPSENQTQAIKAWFDGRDICLNLPESTGNANIQLFDPTGQLLAQYMRSAAPLVRIPAPRSHAVMLRVVLNNQVYSTKVFTL